MSENHPPIINLTSEQLAYGPLSENHIPLSSKWANDWAVSQPRGMLLRPYSRDTVSRWNQQGQTSADRVIFVLYERASHRPIGETGFTALDWFHRTAEFGILIGETDCWGKGYGTEATRTMLQYGFRVLNLHLIWLYVSSANPQAIRAYQRAGFREAGRLREAQFIAGQRCDLISMDCLAHEFLDGALADAPCS